MDKDRMGIDWFGVIVRFLFGAALGAGLPFLCWRWVLSMGDSLGWWVLGGAVAVGTISAIYGDRFWTSFGILWRRW